MCQRAISVSLVILAGLGGCAVGPSYHRPSAPMSAKFKEVDGWVAATPSDAADRADWWTAFGDPILDDLEHRLTVANQTLAGAEAAWHQSQALVREQRAALFPTISLTGSASRSGGGPSPTTNAYKAGAGATWTPDIWGASRRGLEAAKAGAAASRADLGNARLALEVDLALDYIQLRQLDEEKRILDYTVAGYARSLDIAQNRYTAGVAAKSDVLSAQSQLQTTQASDADLSQQRARLEHAIAVLIGQPPAGLTLVPAPWTLTLPTLPGGTPSTLLQRRPDIAAAERRANAANAQIGVQTAAYFPNLTLTGQEGFQSSQLSRLFNASNFAWTLGASAAETIFDAGARGARVAGAKAGYDQAVAAYRQTVLTALAQVEDNLAAQRVLANEQTLRQSALAAANTNDTIARNQYRAGTVDYTTVVVAQATALSAKTSALGIEAARLTTAVDLIAALGGGWDRQALRK